MNNLFGTDGIRNRVGEPPFTLEALPKLGKAIGQWALEKYGPQVTILLAHDTRISCSWVKAALQSGLLTHPITIHDSEVLPTPAVSHIMSQTKKYACGIIISASHNIYHDNGIKIVDAQSGKLTVFDETIISQFFYTNSLASINYQTLGTELVVKANYEKYVNVILDNFSKQFLAGKHIILDTAHGATYQVAPAIFQALGAQVTIINNTPNGININENCGSLYLDSLKQTVLSTKADIGFAFDGDGDRVLAVNALGEIKNGDDLLALLASHPDYAQINTLVGTVMSNQGFEVYLKQQNKKLVRTPVGDKYVLESLIQKNLLLGGEQSGHIILRNIINTGDGILVALKVLEAITYTNNWLLETFTKYPQVLLNVPVKSKQDLNLPPFSDIIAQTQDRLQKGRLLVRYSGTESLLRIMIEEQDEQLALTSAQELARKLEQKLI